MVMENAVNMPEKFKFLKFPLVSNYVYIRYRHVAQPLYLFR